MKMFKEIMLCAAAFGLTAFSLQAAQDLKTPPTKVGDLPKKQLTPAQAEEEEDEDIIRRDQMSGTDTLAVPFDESEMEDEEEINKIEKKEVFAIPRAPSK